MICHSFREICELSDFNSSSPLQENPRCQRVNVLTCKRFNVVTCQRFHIQGKTGQCHRFQVSLARSPRLSGFSHINNVRSVPGYAPSIRAIVRK
jgi:hypothetical protein